MYFCLCIKLLVWLCVLWITVKKNGCAKPISEKRRIYMVHCDSSVPNFSLKNENGVSRQRIGGKQWAGRVRHTLMALDKSTSFFLSIKFRNWLTLCNSLLSPRKALKGFSWINKQQLSFVKGLWWFCNLQSFTRDFGQVCLEGCVRDKTNLRSVLILLKSAHPMFIFHTHKWTFWQEKGLSKSIMINFHCKLIGNPAKDLVFFPSASKHLTVW